MPLNEIAELVAVGGLAGLADRHHHAAPIGVLAGDRGLHQRRIRDRQRDFSRGFLRGGAVDDDLDQLGRAFAVADDLFGEIGQHRVERLRKRLQARVAGAADLRCTVARGGPVAKASSVSDVEVSPSTVMALKLALVAALEQRLQHVGRNRRVGEDEGEHRRHVGRDHARALGDAVE